MSRSNTLPRFIRPYDVEEGDTITASWVNQGVKHSRTAVVDRIIEDGSVFSYHTKEGAEIFHYIPPQDKLVRVTLHATGNRPENNATLFEMEND